MYLEKLGPVEDEKKAKAMLELQCCWAFSRRSVGDDAGLGFA